MNTDFNFVGFEPNDSLREKANRALDRLLEKAPSGAVAVALLEKDEYSFCCAIEIYSKRGPFTARGYNTCPETVLESAVCSLLNKLKHGTEVYDFFKRGPPGQLART